MADKQTSGPPQAPSLFSAGAAAGSASNARILASLEGRADASATHRRRASQPARVHPGWLAVIAVLLLAAAWIWWQSQRASTPAAPRTVTPTMPAVTAPPPSPVSPLAQLGDPPAAAGPAAIIEDERAELTQGTTSGLVVANPLASLNAGSNDASAEPDAAAGRLLALIQADSATQAPTAAAKPPAAVRKPTAPPRAAREPVAEPVPGDQDAALLSALLSLGFTNGTTEPAAAMAMRSLPGLSLSEQLGECRAMGFLRGEQCRLQVCAGQWGIAPECPTAQPGVTP